MENQELISVTLGVYDALDPNGKQDGYFVIYDNPVTGCHEEVWVPTQRAAEKLFNRMNSIIAARGVSVVYEGPIPSERVN